MPYGPPASSSIHYLRWSVHNITPSNARQVQEIVLTSDGWVQDPQQFFTWGPTKHYIHVRNPPGDQQPEEPPAPVDVTTRIAQLLDQLQLNGQSDARTTIQAGEIDEANP